MANDDDKRLGKYLLKAVLGQGGMGTVYLALDTRLRREVALKVLPREFSKNAEAVKRFLREGQAAARLSHPNVVAIYDVDQQRGHTFLVMELVSGGSAHDLIKQGYLTWFEATRIVADACKGLIAAHQAGLIHRDIKPSNILLGKDGSVKLSDFGLVKVIDDETTRNSLTQTGAVLGTPDFMSPEQCQGEKLDERSDIYSLGATYFALLTRRPPYSEEKPLQTMFAHCSKPVPDPRSIVAEVPSACVEVVMKALNKKRSDRFSSATEMYAALQTMLSGSPTDVEGHAAIDRLAEPRTSIGCELASALDRETPTLNEPAASAAPEEFSATPTLDAIPVPLTDNGHLATTITRLNRVSRRQWFWPAVIGMALLLVGSLVMMTQKAKKNADTRSSSASVVETDPVPSAPVVEVTLVRSGEIQKLDERVGALAVSPDEKLIYASQDDGRVTAISVASREVVFRYQGLEKPSRAVAAAPNGKWLAAGCDDGRVLIWDAKSGKQIEILKTERSVEISALAFRADNQRLAVATYGDVRLYAVKDDGRCDLIKSLGDSSTQLVCYMCKSTKFSPDDRLLAATSWESKQAIVWDADNGEFIGNQMGLPFDPFAIDFLSNDCVIIGTGRGDISLWRHPGTSKATITSLPKATADELRSIALLPDGRTLVTAGQWDGPLRLIDLPSQRELERVRNGVYSSPAALIVLPKSRKVVLAGGDDATHKGFIQYWDIVTGPKKD